MIITNESSEFYSRQQKFVFVHPDADIDEETKLPYDEEDYVITDVEELCTVGAPLRDDVEYDFWGFINPKEYFPNSEELTSIKLLNLKEQLQEDIMTYCDGMDSQIIGDLCSLVVKGFDSIGVRFSPFTEE